MRSRTDSANRLHREQRRMLRALKKWPGVQCVILFGSLVRGKTRLGSDIDLVIIQNTRKRFMDRLDEFYQGLCPAVSADILVYTPDEWEELSKKRGFVRRILKEGKVLYAS